MDAIFYLPEIDIRKTEFELPKEESKHAIRVLRMVPGDSLLLTNGKGYFISAVIKSIDCKKCIVSFKSYPKKIEKSYNLHLAISPTKNNNRYEWLLEKITEVGVASITPLITFHSERRNINFSRLEKILISAMKQSQKAYLPELKQATSFQDFINDKKTEFSYIAHCDSSIMREKISDTYIAGKDVTIMIGPEGDFSNDEILKAIDKGFHSIHLGDSRLRTETAGIVASSAIYQLNF